MVEVVAAQVVVMALAVAVVAAVVATHQKQLHQDLLLLIHL
jgi:hypothetical protein